MEDALNEFNAWAPRLVEMGINLLVALLILIIGWWVSSLLGSWVRRAATRSSKIDPTIVPMFYSTVVWAVRIFTVIAVLARFGVQTASLIAVLGAAGLAVGLALQGTLQNIAAGIMLLILRPIRAGEYVALSSGSEGTVEEVGLFLTRLVQGDGIHLTLPNSTVWNATIINYSRNKTRRLDIPVPVRYGDDLNAVLAKLNEIVAARPDALKDPEPQVKVFEYKESGVIVNVRVWAESSKYWDLRWGLYQQIRTSLEAAGFQPPIPLREIQNPKTAGNADAAA
ncbi:Small-conductance mechanosensitive channel [Achromobacter spanius]|jgi:small-conductance mechanosensitive channel|uniref:Small-conductance mechanosensitive channel n=1 Tax=Achromobacter spanius TaxID=217203 RepID=A0AA42LTR4_9BURK|nr:MULTISPECIES: mechanosensitive ion channel domain-containing protein [Achromobacter]AUA58820.1 mechanosensitive ion channel protein MscS [Achromobacter spanius]MCS3504566.1 small-conductance mechanosensitive channel [Achromobacter sp. JUb104]MDH0739351.1 mechanosensitive ion channel [Achromobacter spanius]CAB3672196.1 Small-conductance mechanosensitive channel [Achromobacter spanius]VEE59023.1 Small-conductance mechanosensitive channel [Achromobacter spanius]